MIKDVLAFESSVISYGNLVFEDKNTALNDESKQHIKDRKQTKKGQLPVFLFTRKILHATIIKNRHQRRTPT